MFPAMIHNAPPLRHRTLRGLAFACCLTTLASCGIPVDDRGDLPSADALAQIKPGQTDKATVTRLIGSPSNIASFDGDTWYYISKVSKQVAFLKPTVLDQRVVAIHFDQNGVVTEVSSKGLKDAQAITPDPNATPAQGREFTFLEQLIGNFGKFSGGSGKSGGAGVPGSPNPGGQP
jgi:outer membrane protein assembly factor BamE (lipoprotein component of BamABCDE complex)